MIEVDSVWRGRGQDGVPLEGVGIARYSDDQRHRFLLRRVWDWSRVPLVTIGLNPSTATESVDDPTIRTLIRAAHWRGYGGLWMLNIFSLRSTNPRALYTDREPDHPEHDWHLRDTFATDGLASVVAAWGNHGALYGRGQTVLDMIDAAGVAALCFGVTKTGQPRHALYLRDRAELVRFDGNDRRMEESVTSDGR